VQDQQANESIADPLHARLLMAVAAVTLPENDGVL